MQPTEPAMVPPIQYQWTAQPGDAFRFTKAVTRRLLGKPLSYVVYATIGVFTALSIMESDIWFTAICFGLLIGWTLGPAYTVQQLHNLSMPPGAQWMSGYNSYGMRLRDGLAEMVFAHGAFSAVEVKGDIVTLTVLRTGRVIFLPEELCPPDAREYMASMSPSAAS